MRQIPSSPRAAAVLLGLAASLIAASFPLPAAAQAPDPRLAAIRSYAAEIQALIAEADKEAEGGGFSGLYGTEIFLNSRNGSWRAVGSYFQKIAFWHTDQPEFAGEGKPEASVLVKAEIQEGAAIRTSYRDYLFRDGRLVFAYLKEKSGDGPFEERRYYYDGGKLFRVQIDKDVKAQAPDAEIVAEAAALQARFLALYR